MKKLFCLVAIVGVCLLASGEVKAQDKVDGNVMAGLLADGYTIKEMEAIIKEVTYGNYKKWMKKKGYKYSEAMNNGYTQAYMKGEVVQIGLFFSPNDKELKYSIFYSSPQKFYRAKGELEGMGFVQSNLKLIDNETGGSAHEEITWKKKGYPYTFVTNTKINSIQILK